MTGELWSAAGLTAEPVSQWHPHMGVVLHLPGRRGGVSLRPEHERSLAWWLLAHVGDREGPADPDQVRVAIDTARAALAARSSEDVSEDYRAGLAWCARWLDDIAAAAS